VSDKTLVGVAAGWISASQGTKSKVYVEAAPGREATQALFRAVQGTASVRYRSFSVSLAPAHSVTLDIDTALQGSLCFRRDSRTPVTWTSAGRCRGRHRRVGAKGDAGLLHRRGRQQDEDLQRHQLAEDGEDPHRHAFRRQGGQHRRHRSGHLRPDRQRHGAIEVLFAVVEFEIIERAISLTTEFATLTQSNFSDVK
jgi:hypothetical protein